MQQYLDIVKNILDNGEWKTPERVREDCTLTRTKVLTHVLFQHDMSLGFPIMTTRKMPWKTMKVELEGFIGGITNKRWYQENGCNIWNQWANPVAVTQHWLFSGTKSFEEEKLKIQEGCDDLGPFYAWQLRNFGVPYVPNEPNSTKLAPLYKDPRDQLATIVHTLKNRPNDRRMVVSYWNPSQFDQMSLPACGYTWGVQHVNGHLDLFYTLRSCDFLLGNAILTFGLLLTLLAKTSNLIPRKLTGFFADCHIYENQIEGATQLIKRKPRPLPTLELNPTNDNDSFDIFQWTHNNAKLINYDPYGPLSFGDIIV